MTLEKVARAICAQGGNVFCRNIGGSIGCKCGRGEAPSAPSLPPLPT